MSYLPVQLDKTRNILLGFNGLKIFKNKTGTSLAKMDYENTDMEDYIPVIFYAGLVHEDPDLTLEKTTELIDKHLGVSGALEMLPKILEETFGKVDDVKNAPRAVKKK